MTAVMTPATEIEEAHQRELAWLLQDIHRELNQSVAVGLQECQARLCDRDNGVKLVMSSGRRDTVKGTVDRIGTALSECDITVRLTNANRGYPFQLKLLKGKTFPLMQVVDSLNFITEALDHIQECTRAGPTDNPMADIKTRLGLSHALLNVKNALSNIHDPQPVTLYPQHVLDRSVFEDMPADTAIDFYIVDSNIICDVRAIEDIESSHNPLDTFANAMFTLGKKRPGSPVPFNGTSVVEHERVRVETQDPNLISVTAKLTALEAHLEALVRKLQLCLAS